MAQQVNNNNNDDDDLFNDEEKKALSNPRHTFRIKCDCNDEYVLVGRPCELSAFSFVPANRVQVPRERTIYNSKKPATDLNPTDYDKTFNVTYTFDNKVHRCDRKHAKLHGLDRWSEEIYKQVPTLSSSVYGEKIVEIVDDTRKPIKVKYNNEGLESMNRKHVRIGKVKSEFYNRNGINDLNRQRGVL